MKTIKYFFFTLISVLLSLCIVSCSKEYSSPLKGQAVDDVIIDGSIGKTITIGKDDLSKCSITSSTAWCSATIQVSSVIINVQPNDTYGERQATITLTDPEDATTLSFKVIQKQNDAILVDGKLFSIPEEGGIVSIKVQSNVSYNVEIPATASWLTKSTSSTRGLTSSTIVLRADKNNSGDERETIVKLSDSSSGVSSQFTVKQELTPFIVLEKEDYSIDAEGGDIDILVKSNIELTIKVNDKWIVNVVKENKGDFDLVQTFRVSSFSGNQTKRAAKITISDKTGKWNISKDIIITQTINPKLYVHAVDLGLSVKWGSCNLGAMKPEDCGWYFAWGELEPKSMYIDDTYIYYLKDIGENISGTKYDAASVILGGKWRMPTVSELTELINGCTWERIVENNKMKGYKIIGRNGNSIFIPNSGWYYLNYVVSQEEMWGATFWTSTKTMLDYAAYVLSDKIHSASNTYGGYPIRPITQ